MGILKMLGFEKEQEEVVRISGEIVRIGCATRVQYTHRVFLLFKGDSNPRVFDFGANVSSDPNYLMLEKVCLSAKGDQVEIEYIKKQIGDDFDTLRAFTNHSLSDVSA